MSTEPAQGAFDRAKADAFAARLLTALNDGALCLMASIGHRTGLFDAMSTSPAATSEEIAARAGLNERYVREWLGARVRQKPRSQERLCQLRVRRRRLEQLR